MKGNCKNAIHPNQKNVDFQKFLIELSTNEGDIVLDPFMGSGSCGEACLLCNRKFIGIEQDEFYYNATKQRLEEIKNDK